MSVGDCCFSSSLSTANQLAPRKDAIKYIGVTLLCLGIIAGAGVASFYLSGKKMHMVVFAAGGALVLELVAINIFISYRKKTPEKRQNAPHISQTALRISRKADQILDAQGREFARLQFKPTIPEHKRGITKPECVEICQYIEANRARIVKEVLEANRNITVESKKHKIPRTLLFALEEGNKVRDEQPSVKIYILFNKSRDGQYTHGAFKTIKLALNYDMPHVPYASFSASDPEDIDASIPQYKRSPRDMNQATMEFNGFNLTKDINGFMQCVACSEPYHNKTRERFSMISGPFPAYKRRFIVELRPKGDLLNHYQEMPLADKLRWIKKLMENVANAHRKGILIRDIKLDNILLEEDGTPIFCDLAQICHENDVNSRKQVSGTEGAVSPEYAIHIQRWHKEKPTDPAFNTIYDGIGDATQKARDIWALGVLFVEILMGVKVGAVRDNDLFTKALECAQTKKPYKLERFEIPGCNSELKSKIYDLLDRMFIVDPKKRITAEELLKESSLFNLSSI